MSALDQSCPAPPLHVQHLHKALRVEPFLAYVGRVFSDPILANLSDDGDGEHEKGSIKHDGNCVNGEVNTASDCLSPDELRIDKSRLYNFNKVKKERKWLRDVLLSDSSESSDEDQPMTDEDLKEMLWLHKKQRLARHMFYIDGDLGCYQYYSASLLGSQDKYCEVQKQLASRKVRRKKIKEGGIQYLPLKEKKSRIKRRRRKSEDVEEDLGTLTFEERILKKYQIRRKEADVKRRKLWALIVRKEIPRAHRQKTSARNSVLSNAKKLAQMCQKEMRKEAQRSQKVTQQAAPRARRLNREMMVYWKKYEKVEKEHRKRAEKEAQEQRKLDDELLEARRQQRKLNFLITQTELYAHFMSKKIKGTMGDEGAEEILKKLDESSTRQNLKTVTGGVLIDMENTDSYDAQAMKKEALRNAQRAVLDQEARTRAFDDNCDLEKSKVVPLSQESFDSSYSLANPALGGHDHPQPQQLNGTLKSYQLKGMNWLVNLYEQGISGILADEMGLGKTVQSIAFLTYLAETHNIWGPFLVVAPASTLHNWQQEVTRFMPPFKVLPYWGNQVDRKSLRKYWSQNQSHINDRVSAPFHVLITSYQLVVQDVRYFQRIKWQYVVLDEAQAIKSSSSVRWKILLGFQCRNRLLLTGTPIQNSMAELWALLHFIMPTLFDSHEEFNEWFSKDIESHAENRTSVIDQNQLSRLHMILKPFMLRRIKADVENELSDKIEIQLVCHLTTRQRWLYQAVKNKISIDDLVYTSASSSSTASTTTSNLMNLVMQFRKVCNHPELFERRDVRSPAHVEVAPYLLPKLIYREGIVSSAHPGRDRIVYNALNIWTAEYIHYSLFPRMSNRESRKNAASSNCFACLRFISVSPGEMSATMLKGVEYRILALLLFLKYVRNLYHQRLWMQEQIGASVGCYGLVLSPDFTLSFPGVQSSPVLSSLVFAGHTRGVVSHVTHTVCPILSEEDGKPVKPVKQRSRTKSQGAPTRRASATSPTKVHHRHPHHHQRHHQQSSADQHHPPRRPSTGALASPPPSGAFSPTASSRHHGRVPVSPTKTHHHRHHPPHQSHPLTGHALPSLSPTGPVPSLQLLPGGSGSPPFSAGVGAPEHGHSSFLLMPMTQLVSTLPAEPIDRTLQPTMLPSFLHTYIPKVLATNKLCYCSDRSAAYEVEQLLRGGSRLARNLYLYGAADSRGCEENTRHLFPQPCGGLEAARPKYGWSFVQIPDRNSLITDSGKLNVLDGLLTKLKAQGHRVLIYSQMTRMIDLLEEYMTYRKHKYMRLDGSSKISERRDMVADFQTKSDIFVFLLSTRAGGLGINLTAADTVIFYDSDWNPTVDQQAMDRAHRLGQTRQVTVYRLVIKGTIEERILQRAKEKSEIQRMVISGGNFKPDALKPKEVVSLLLDDAELESKFLMRQAEKKAEEQRRRRERKRKKGGPAIEGTEGTGSDLTATPPPKTKKGRKSKGALVPPAPEGGLVISKPASEASSTNGEVINISRVDNELDDISVLSLDEVSLASGDASFGPSTLLTFRPDGGDDSNLDETRSQDNSPASLTSMKRGRGRGRGRGRARNTTSTRGRGSGSVRPIRGRGRGRGGGALAASVAASAAAAAASAAVFSAYGFAFQGNTTSATPPPSRSSPVPFGSGVPVTTGYSPGTVITQPVARYANTSAYSPGEGAEGSPARTALWGSHSGHGPPHTNS